MLGNLLFHQIVHQQKHQKAQYANFITLIKNKVYLKKKVFPSQGLYSLYKQVIYSYEGSTGEAFKYGIQQDIGGTSASSIQKEIKNKFKKKQSSKPWKIHCMNSLILTLPQLKRLSAFWKHQKQFSPIHLVVPQIPSWYSPKVVIWN